MQYSSGNGGTRVELYARSSLPAAADRRREAVANELEALAAAGRIDDYRVDAWRKRVPVDGDSPERLAYERFRDWAVRRDLTLEPCFSTRECYDRTTGDQRTDLVMPALCLAVVAEGDLVQVYPHVDDGESRSVVTGLTELAESPRTEEERRVASPMH